MMVIMRVMIHQLLFLIIITVVTSSAAAYSVPLKDGIEIRVCQDRDCQTDGAQVAYEMMEQLAAGTPAKVTKCGCIGPCGGGPNMVVQQDGIRLKSSFDGGRVFGNVNTPQAGAQLLEVAGIDVPDRKLTAAASKFDDTIVSTRALFDFDRTTRIAFQRVLYIVTALPMLDAYQNGYWDEIGGTVYENSYSIIAAFIFAASQFMGTGSKANSIES